MGILGPSTKLPGDIIAPLYSTCDTHEDRPSVASIVGETDSFGSETDEVCQECLDAYKARKAAGEQVAYSPDDCDGCGGSSTDIKPCRDPDEGLAGPVYYWCTACRKDVLSRWSE